MNFKVSLRSADKGFESTHASGGIHSLTTYLALTSAKQSHPRQWVDTSFTTYSTHVGQEIPSTSVDGFFNCSLLAASRVTRLRERQSECGHLFGVSH